MIGKRLSDEEFRNIYSKVPRICVDLVIGNEKGILLTKRAIDPDKGKWHFPGGGIRFDETLSEAAKRIAKNELDIEIDLGKNIGHMEFLGEEDRQIRRHSISVVFFAKMITDKITLNEEADEYSFFSEVPENTTIQHKEFLKSNPDLFSRYNNFIKSNLSY